jgi:Protein of unknown function (DUF1091)
MRTLTPYYNSVINTTLDFCEFTNGSSKNIAVRWFLGMFQKSLPVGFLHPCPYFGEIRFSNCTIGDFIEAPQFLTGLYKCTTRIFDRKDENILTVKHCLEAKDVREF